MEKESSVKFLNIFYEVMKLQSFEFDISDLIPVNTHDIFKLAFFHTFAIFMEKESLLSFLRSHEVYPITKIWMIVS